MTKFSETPGGRAAAIFLLVFSIALATRFYLVSNVKTCLDGDESVSCVLAHHIESRGERPVFPYGLRYNGAGAVEAYIAAALNSAAGRDTFHALVIPIVEFALFAALSSMLALRVGGPLFGFLLGLHVVFSPQFYRASMRIAGYDLTLAAMLLLAYFVMSRMTGPETSGAGGNPPKFQAGALAGVLAGVAFWFHEFSAVLIAALFISVALRWRAKAVPALLAWIIAFPAGAAPAVWSYLKFGFGGVHQGAQKISIIGQLPPGPWWTFFTNELPSFFKNENWGSFTPGVPWTAWLLFAATMLGCAAAAIPRPRDKFRCALNLQIPRFAALYGFLFISVYILSPYRGDTPRRLLALEPFMSIAAAAGVLSLLLRPSAAAKTAAAALIAASIVADFNGTAFALRDDTVWDGNQDVSCKRVDNMMDTLEQRNITKLYTSSFLKWIILCRGEEKITAADIGLTRSGRGRDKWSEAEESMSSVTAPAYMFNARDQRLPWLLAYLREHKTSLLLIDMGEYVLVNPDGPAPRDDFMGWSFKMQELQNRKR